MEEFTFSERKSVCLIQKLCVLLSHEKVLIKYCLRLVKDQVFDGFKICRH